MDKKEVKYTYPVVMSVAGSDSGGGAGIQADIKTISSLGMYAATAITAVTVQNTRGVDGVFPMEASWVMRQMEAICSDMEVKAMKTGLLFDASIVAKVAEMIVRYHLNNVVVDPVMIATSGDSLAQSDLCEALVDKLFPLSTLITPNLPETETILQRKVTTVAEMKEAAKELLRLGPHAVLIKGGHLIGDMMIDILALRGDEKLYEWKADKIDTVNLHGTGCTLSAAIASFLAQGKSICDSVKLGKKYVHQAINQGADVNLGHGPGPVNHGWSPKVMYKIEQTNRENDNESICK